MAYINNDYSEPNSSYVGSGSGQIVMRLGKMAPWIVGRSKMALGARSRTVARCIG